jgi:hypothetical protein
MYYRYCIYYYTVYIIKYIIHAIKDRRVKFGFIPSSFLIKDHIMMWLPLKSGSIYGLHDLPYNICRALHKSHYTKLIYRLTILCDDRVCAFQHFLPHWGCYYASIGGVIIIIGCIMTNVHALCAALPICIYLVSLSYLAAGGLQEQTAGADNKNT